MSLHKLVLLLTVYSSLFYVQNNHLSSKTLVLRNNLSNLYEDLRLKNDETELFKAMKDEMKRSFGQLRLDGVDSLYYLQYVVLLYNVVEVKTSKGGVVKVTQKPYATLSVQARVGSPKMDNTNFFDVSLNFFGSSDDEESFENRIIPFELDYPTLRNELWLATDVAYKQATEILAKKVSYLQNKVRKDSTPDFYLLPPIQFSLPSTSVELTKQEQTQIPFNLAQLSKRFLVFPEIINSQVNFEFIQKRMLFCNSEGREFAKSENFCGVEVVALTQREDGMLLSNTYSNYQTSPKKYSFQQIGTNKHFLEKEIDSLAATVIKLKNAEPLEDPYSGPVMFTGQATGELFGQFFIPNLVVQRQALSDQGFDATRNIAFQNKVGGRVLNVSFSVNAITGNSKLQDSVVGSFLYDDQGIETPERIELVKNGYLVTLLNDRTLTKKFTSSNGHHRSGGTAPGVIEISYNGNKESYESLKKKMMELCKKRDLPFGLVVKKVVNQNLLFTSIYRLSEGEYPIARGEAKVNAIEVYKVYADGKEELITSPEINGLTVGMFKEIIGASNITSRYSYLASAIISPFITGGAQFLPTTLFFPETILVEELEVKPNQEEFSKPPILASPLLAK